MQAGRARVVLIRHRRKTRTCKSQQFGERFSSSRSSKRNSEPLARRFGRDVGADGALLSPGLVDSRGLTGPAGSSEGASQSSRHHASFLLGSIQCFWKVNLRSQKGEEMPDSHVSVHLVF